MGPVPIPPTSGAVPPVTKQQQQQQQQQQIQAERSPHPASVGLLPGAVPHVFRSYLPASSFARYSWPPTPGYHASCLCHTLFSRHSPPGWPKRRGGPVPPSPDSCDGTAARSAYTFLPADPAVAVMPLASMYLLYLLQTLVFVTSASSGSRNMTQGTRDYLTSSLKVVSIMFRRPGACIPNPVQNVW